MARLRACAREFRFFVRASPAPPRFPASPAPVCPPAFARSAHCEPPSKATPLTSPSSPPSQQTAYRRAAATVRRDSAAAAAGGAGLTEEQKQEIR